MGFGLGHFFGPPGQFDPGQLPGQLVPDLGRQIFDFDKGSQSGQPLLFVDRQLPGEFPDSLT